MKRYGPPILLCLLLGILFLRIGACTSWSSDNPLDLTPEQVTQLQEKTKAGDFSACMQLADYYALVKYDNLAAAHWWQILADQGNDDALVEVGSALMYAGKFDEAEKWMLKAKEKGDPVADKALQRLARRREQAAHPHYFTAANVRLIAPVLFIVTLFAGRWFERRASARLTEDERRTAESVMESPPERWLLIGLVVLILCGNALIESMGYSFWLTLALYGTALAVGLFFALRQLWRLGRHHLPTAYVRTVRVVWILQLAMAFLMISSTLYSSWNSQRSRTTASVQH